MAEHSWSLCTLHTQMHIYKQKRITWVIQHTCFTSVVASNQHVQVKLQCILVGQQDVYDIMHNRVSQNLLPIWLTVQKATSVKTSGVLSLIT